VTILALTMRILGIIVRAIIGGSLSAFLFHGWWILGILAVGLMLAIWALRMAR